MDIYLTDLETNDSLRFPVLPEEVRATIGNQFASYQILGVGEIRVPGGVALDNISWSGFFPGENRKDAPYVVEWTSPLEAYKWIENCKIQVGTPKKLRLLITETAINVDVYVDSFNKTYSGGYGDIGYDITLIQAKDLIVSATSSTTSAGAAETGAAAAPVETVDTATTEESRPSPPDATTYTVVSGDSLWAIAQRLLGDGSRYPELYAANISTIEGQNSGTGNPQYTIYPGQVFTLPG